MHYKVCNKAKYFVFMLVMCGCPAAVLAEPASPTVITWIRLDYPPSYITKGDNAGNGAFEKVRDFLADKLVQYDMRVIDMSRKRFWHELQRQQNYCEVGSIKTSSRQSYAFFSVPMTLLPPAKIIFNQKRWLQLGKPKTMRLADLLSDNTLTGAIVSKRSYGYSLDTLLNRYDAGGVTNMQRKVTKLDSLYSMIELQRLDYTIDYEVLVTRFSRDRGSSNLKSVTIDEEAKYHTLHISCTKNIWGQQIIAHVNEVLLRYRTRDEFRQCFTIFGSEFNGEFYQRHKKTLNELR